MYFITLALEFAFMFLLLFHIVLVKKQHEKLAVFGFQEIRKMNWVQPSVLEVVIKSSNATLLHKQAFFDKIEHN